MANYNVGDKVWYKGDKMGTVIEVPELDPSQEQHYSVVLDDPPTKPDGTPADHEKDTLGCVLESDLSD